MATARKQKPAPPQSRIEDQRIRSLQSVFPDEDLSVIDVSVALDRADVEITRALTRRFMPYGVTTVAMQAMISIRLSDDAPLSYEQLGQELRVTKANISWVLKRLEADRLITRRTDPNDRRKIRAKLTQRGAAVVDELVIVARDTLEEMFVGLKASERAQLKRLLSRISWPVG
jgi:DNA-binding MarR family transcriptional regulator